MGVLTHAPSAALNIYIHTPTYIYIYFVKCSAHQEATGNRRHGGDHPWKVGGAPCYEAAPPNFVLNVKNWEQF